MFARPRLGRVPRGLTVPGHNIEHRVLAGSQDSLLSNPLSVILASCLRTPLIPTKRLRGRDAGPAGDPFEP